MYQLGIERVRAAHQQVVFFSYGGLLWPQSEISWKPISFHLLGGMGQECEEVGTEVAVLKARLGREQQSPTTLVL